MGIFDRFTKKVEEQRSGEAVREYFKMVTAYSPSFSSFTGSVYEMDLTRSAIHRNAVHISKANPKILGGKYRKLEAILQNRPNDIMTTSQFAEKVASIFFAENNVFLIPLYEDRTAARIAGIFPVRGADAKIVTVNGKLMLQYKVYPNDAIGETHAIPYAEVGHMRNHFYRKEFYGESNNALAPTLNLLNTQQEAILNAVTQSATIRFLAKLANMLKPDDLKAEQKRMREINLSQENNGGVFMYDAKYASVQPVYSKPYTVDPEQAKMIQNNVYSYFGVNENILQNKQSNEEFSAYYEGVIEPFLVQLSQVMTNMLFSAKDIEDGCRVVWESSKFEYMTFDEKNALASSGIDRGYLSVNEVRTKLFNLPPIEGGDSFIRRLDYAQSGKEKDDNTE